MSTNNLSKTKENTKRNCELVKLNAPSQDIYQPREKLIYGEGG